MFCGFTLVNHKQLRASLVKNTKPALGPVVIRCTEQPSMLDMHCQHTRYSYRKLIKVRMGCSVISLRLDGMVFVDVRRQASAALVQALLCDMWCGCY